MLDPQTPPLTPESPKETPPAPEPPAEPEQGEGLLTILREWGDALVFAFVVAMFVRVFVVELFKIPTGSMSPTLLGDSVAHVDWDEDGLEDIIVRGQSRLMAFMQRVDGDLHWYEPIVGPNIRRLTIRRWEDEGILKPQYDRILVSKFAYWLRDPRRGDVVVFKVPKNIWDPEKPIYIKRVTGLPGERISFDGRLKAGGDLVEEPPFFRHQKYTNDVNLNQQSAFELPYVDYRPRVRRGYGSRRDEFTIAEVNVPKSGVFVMGDNTNSSLDSRYWGVVPLKNLKGRAFFRYWPFSRMKFIE